ncbi:MAG: alpha-L-fucosidase [Chitinophagaceae bacterium]|nr:MAG: alpha-L-fucosidase [Chitinophagaceae bacterium]
MMRSDCLLLFVSVFALNLCFGQVSAPRPVGPVPSANQWRWQQMEYYAFVHFSLNTYTDQSWGFGNEDINLFNPEKLDVRQWARICKESGMKGIIVTAKHHSGFCLWPSKYTEYSVKNAPWKNGKGDIMRELADACKAYGLKLGVYLSPWDRNHPDYGKPEYITYFRNQLTELLTNYGEIFEVWFDGANGGSGYYGGANENRKIDRTTYYDWPNTYKLVRRLQPNIVIWNDGGDRADLRWVGTEAGYVGETNWSLLDSTGDVPENMLRHGVESGNKWVPGEVNTSIRPEWFYHPKEDTKVKTLPQLLDIYYHSVGRNATLLLNFPVMPNGLIHHYDEKAVLDLAAAVKNAFSVNLVKDAKITASRVRANDERFSATMAIDDSDNTYWTTDDNIKNASLTLDFSRSVTFNRFMAQEYIRLGQRIKSFTLEAWMGEEWKPIAIETTVGYKRILRFPSVTTTKVRFTITDAKYCPLISNIALYNAPLILQPPAIIRKQSGDLQIISSDAEAWIYYTLDGSNPTAKSNRYNGEVKTPDSKLLVKSVTYDPRTKNYSEVTTEQFDIPRKNWKIESITDNKAYAIFDGDPNTQWYQANRQKMPVDLVIDLGKTENVSGFKYLPDQNPWAKGIISNYVFSISDDGNRWVTVDTGEFSNIKNNPVWQIKTFTPIKARYVKLQAKKNTQDNDFVGYAEIDIITD